MSFLDKLGLGDDGPREALYSPALALRMRGRYAEAVAAIEAQLQRFPNDFQGQMLKAEIQAQNLHDLPGAETTIRHLCRQPEHPPGAVAFALNTLADWHLALAKDPDRAREVLEQIPQRFPGTQLALRAEQRLAHLATGQQLHDTVERKPIKVKVARRPAVGQPLTAAEVIQTKAPEQELDELVTHLEQYPLDLDAREQLALLLAREFQRLDLAVGQFEELIGCPNVSPRQVVHWLNELADVHTAVGGDVAAAEAALRRIVELYPGSAFAAQAAQRIMTLPNEVRVHREPRPLKLGQYEQRLGLKIQPSCWKKFGPKQGPG